MDYELNPRTRIGHVHLTVANLERALSFYRDMMGFQVTARFGKNAVFLSSGNYHHHIGLNTWYSKNAQPAPVYSAGLFHTAILYPTRKDLAEIYKRLREAKYPFTGFADHGVSEAIYLNDPDENGVELYWDKPPELWPKKEDASLLMYTKALDMVDLLKELD